ncbi:MAG: hypothetical protein J6034_00355, partial [Bacteroidaceae bacterium]|nr:hypothetical protein [Bacteroidaceae bacterium]
HFFLHFSFCPRPVIRVISEFKRLSLVERTAYSHRKNGFFYQKERLILPERTAYSTRKNGFLRQIQNKNELHLCNSLSVSVAGAGIEPATS